MDSKNVKLLFTNTVTYIQGKLDKETYAALKKEIGYTPQSSAYMVENWVANNPDAHYEWDGTISTVCYNRTNCRCHVKREGTHFPSGLLGKVRSLFENRGIEYAIEDRRKPIQKTLNYKMSDEYEIRDYQEDIVKKACAKNKGRGIIRCATGGGKTSICSHIIAELGVSPFIFYVPSVDLMEQARSEISKFVRLHNVPVEVGRIGDGICDIKDINVMTIQTAVRALGEKYVKFDEEDDTENEDNQERYKDIKDLIISSKGMIADECQFWAAETAQIISDYSISCRYKFGCSATPFRDLDDDILIEACFGKIFADISASYLIKRGFLIKPQILLVPITNTRGSGLRSYPKIYKASITDNPVRNQIICDLSTNFESKGRVILILCKHVSHGKMLEKMIPGSLFLHGGSSSKKRKAHLDKMRGREASITIASTIFDQGIDVRVLDTLILAGSGKSKVRALQRIGRILRPYPGKTDAIAVDFMDNAKYVLSHSKEREKIYRTEEEFDIQRLFL